MKNILITGGAGFIGSNFVKYMLNKYEYNIINLDLLTYAGNISYLDEVSHLEKYKFIHGDIRDKDLLKNIFLEHNIDIVVNFAAESHVDRSITEPEIFISTNIMGTQTLLDVAMNFWKENKEDKNDRTFKEKVKFVQISTDEVYGDIEGGGFFTEKTSISPSSPYSASKASSDLLVNAYFRTYGLPINITRCSNNYGPHQNREKLIPLMITNCIENKKLPVYGDGKQVRDWLFVEDHCSAIDAVIHKGKIGETYNIGGNNEVENIEVVKKIIKYLGKNENLIDYVKDRPGHDRRYAIDNSKITHNLDWKPKYEFEEGLKNTIDWYVKNGTRLS